MKTREWQLIDILKYHRSPMTAQCLADQLGVSAKTIYRMVRKINDWSGRKLIYSQVGKGLRMDYDGYLELDVQQEAMTEPNRRRKEILLQLLYRSPRYVALDTLFGDYFVSESVIHQDLVTIEDWLGPYGLNLGRKPRKIALIGPEKQIRSLVDALNSDLGLYPDFSEWIKDQDGTYDLDFITMIFDELEKKLGAHLSYPYNLNIFSHLYILMKRSKDGLINSDLDESDYATEELDLILDNIEVYRISKYIINRMRNYLQLSIPAFEDFYLFFHLISSRYDDKEVVLHENTHLSYQIAEALLTLVGKRLGLSLCSAKYAADLVKHIHPLLYRLKNGFVVKNDLLDDIKLEYREMFVAVEEAMQDILKEEGLPPISEDEIAFLTPYLVKYKELNRQKRRILIMCSSGVGTSELLRTKVDKSIPDIEIVDVLSAHLYEKRKQNYGDIDLILTTVNVPVEGNIPTVLVSAVFTKQDEERVKRIIGGS